MFKLNSLIAAPHKRFIYIILFIILIQKYSKDIY